MHAGGADMVMLKRKRDGAESREGTSAWNEGVHRSRQSVQTKEQQVAETIREKIFAGDFVRGQKLKQAEIAAALGISITPVRAALKLLEAEGYVSATAHRGAVVSPFQTAEIGELLDLRLGLEPRLMLAAVKRASTADLDALSVLNAELADAAGRGDRGAIRAINYRFHFRLYQIAGLRQSVELVRILWAKYPFELLSSVVGQPERAAAEHAAIIDAARRGDGHAAMRAMQMHIRRGYRALRSTYSL
jgi:DNA-binding GntR family transcriptional regulator